MFLLPSIGVGFLFAVLLGGRPSRLVEVELRAPWAVAIALAIQGALFSSLGARVPATVAEGLHIASYGLLVLFAVANRRLLALWPLLAGMLLNAIVVTANHGLMPVSRSASAAAGLTAGSFHNVSGQAHSLAFLGDVFALPHGLPLSNTFSVGDVLICFGMIAFVVIVSTRDERSRNSFALAATFEPFRVPAYRALICGKLVSFVGDWLTVGTVIGWIYAETHSTAAVAATLVARLGPPILGGGVAAYVVDRLPKGPLLTWIELARGVAAAAALAGVLGHSLPVVLGALALSGGLSAVSAATTSSLTPALVTRKQLPAANAGLGMVKNMAMALGAGGAGLTLTASSAPAALLIDIGTFAVAAALFTRLRLAAPAGRAPRSSRANSGAWRYVVQRRRILLLILSFATATFATGLTNAILPRFLADNTTVGPGAYGFAIAALGLGLAAGEASVGFSRIGVTSGRWIGVGLLTTGAVLAVLAPSHHAASIFLLLGLVGFLDGSTDILYDLVIQRQANPEYYGATFGISSAITATTMVAGFALAVPLGALISPQGVVGVSGAAFGLGGVIALLAIVRAPARGPRPAGEGHPAATIPQHGR